MAVRERLLAAHRFDPARFIPFRVGAEALGNVRRDFARHLLPYRDVLHVRTSAVVLNPSLDSYAARSEALAGVAQSLAARGLLTQWRDEIYDISAPGSEVACFGLERAAVRFFGFGACAVHLNGLSREGSRMCMWIAKRSADKAIDPGKYDNMVGGGVARGLSIEQTLVKEAWEEAGMESSLALRSRSVGTLQVRREVDDGLHVETIYIYDVVLPSTFRPDNQDGEVAEFRCLPLECIARELEGEASYTDDAALVAIDCLSRHLEDFAALINSPG